MDGNFKTVCDLWFHRIRAVPASSVFMRRASNTKLQNPKPCLPMEAIDAHPEDCEALEETFKKRDSGVHWFLAGYLQIKRILPKRFYVNPKCGTFRKLGGTFFWGPYSKDPTI